MEAASENSSGLAISHRSKFVLKCVQKASKEKRVILEKDIFIRSIKEISCQQKSTAKGNTGKQPGTVLVVTAQGSNQC